MRLAHDHLSNDRTATGGVRIRVQLGTAHLSDLIAPVNPTRDFAGVDDLVVAVAVDPRRRTVCGATARLLW